MRFLDCLLSQESCYDPWTLFLSQPAYRQESKLRNNEPLYCPQAKFLVRWALFGVRTRLMWVVGDERDNVREQ